MNDNQEDKYNMYKTVSDHLGDNAADYADHPKIAPAKTSLDELLEDMEEADGDATEDISGVAADKSEERVKLENICYKVSSAMSSYAKENEDRNLQEKTDFSLSDFRQMRDGDLNVKAGKLLKKATPIIADLADFRLLPAHLTELTDQKADFADSIEEPRDAQIDRAVAGNTVDRVMKSIDTLLDKVDGYVESYRFDNIELWEAYQMSREIVNSGGGSGGGGGSTPSEPQVFNGTVLPGSSNEEGPITYVPETNISLVNTGTVSLFFTLTVDSTPNGITVEVTAGNTENTTLGAMAENADGIGISNTDDAFEGNYTITVG